MADGVRIFSYLPNPRVWKSTIAGRLCGVPVEVRGAKPDQLKEWLWDFDARPLTEISPDALDGLARTSRRGFANSVLYKTEQFLQANPYGTVPAAFSADGAIGVFESNSIMRLVARLGGDGSGLWGAGPFEASRIDSFLDAALGFGHDTQRYLLSLIGGKLDSHVHAAALQAAHTYLPGIERTLSRGAQVLVGSGISLADICFACEIALLTSEQRSADLLRDRGMAPVLTGALWAEYPNALAHFHRLIGHPAFEPDLSAYASRYATMVIDNRHPETP